MAAALRVILMRSLASVGSAALFISAAIAADSPTQFGTFVATFAVSTILAMTLFAGLMPFGTQWSAQNSYVNLLSAWSFVLLVAAAGLALGFGPGNLWLNSAGRTVVLASAIGIVVFSKGVLLGIRLVSTGSVVGDGGVYLIAAVLLVSFRITLSANQMIYGLSALLLLVGNASLYLATKKLPAGILHVRSVARAVLPINVGAASRALIGKGDVVAISVLVGAASSGMFALASSVAIAVTLPASALAASRAADLAGVQPCPVGFSSKDAVTVSTIMTDVARRGFAFGAPAAVVAVLAGPRVLASSGAAPSSSELLALWILIAGSLASTLFGPVGYVMQLIGMSKSFARTGLIAAPVAIAVSIMAASLVGMVGVAIGSMTVLLGLNWHQRRLVDREIRGNPIPIQ